MKELHVRVACPPIISPCFYGIDMSTLQELFAQKFIDAANEGDPDPRALQEMARELKVDSLRYLTVEELAQAIGCEKDSLCLGCVTGKYPTEWGNRLLQDARKCVGADSQRVFDK